MNPGRVRIYLIAIAVLSLSVTGILVWYSLSDAPTPVAPVNHSQPGKSEIDTAEAAEDPEKIRLAAKQAGANELGLVPVLIYHQIGLQESRWTRTPENFRHDLQELWDRKYILVPLSDYLNGNMNVPAGKSPAVITFDDSTAGQFQLLQKDGETVVDPNCAVGILRDFGAKHPGFGHAATFFINAQPFGQADLWQKKLQMLNEWGFEIGNHTYSHKYLKGLTPAQVAEEIVRLQEHIRQALPGYQPKSFAIVQDGVPENYDSMMSGEARGVKYKHDGIVRWAWSAAYPPFHREFDPKRIQRIQVFQDGGTSSLVNWLNRISGKRYISDGRKDTLAIPADWQEALAKNHGRKLVIYEQDRPRRNPAKEKQAAEAKGIHVTFSYASSRDRWQKILALIEREHLNAVELDIKDESGRLGYLSGVKTARETGAGRNMLPIREMLADLRARKIYSVGRIVIFRDPFLAQKKPQLRVRNQNGTPVLGGDWVNPYAREVWDYNVELAMEAYELGFDEIQFDYIRFPEKRGSSSVAYGTSDSRPRAEVIAELLRYARSRVGWERILSTTVFGFTGFAVDDMGIGQRPEVLAPYVDYMSPMVYPSHYSRGNYGFANPNAHPYEVVDGSMKDINRLIESTGCRLRPWLQAFSLGKPPYGTNEVRTQIKAVQDNSVNTWLLWNPGVRYPEI